MREMERGARPPPLLEPLPATTAPDPPPTPSPHPRTESFFSPAAPAMELRPHSSRSHGRSAGRQGASPRDAALLLLRRYYRRHGCLQLSHAPSVHGGICCSYLCVDGERRRPVG